MLEILQVPTLRDNYSYLLHDTETKTTAVVDPGEADPVIAAAEERGWTISKILLTHHHDDHIAGMHEICANSPCCVVAALADDHRIPDVNEAVTEEDTVHVGKAIAKVFNVPGHTKGHIAYWFADDKAVFTGDTLFALGCGRLFEGSAKQMWEGLCKLKALPDDTLVYCGHEYTLANATFAAGIETGNTTLQERVAEIKALREANKPTVPSLLGLEKATNPFLRSDTPELAAAIGMIGGDAAEIFAEIRKRKDNA